MTSITTARRIGLNHFRCASRVDTSSAIESFRFCNLDKIQHRERGLRFYYERSEDLDIRCAIMSRSMSRRAD